MHPMVVEHLSVGTPNLKLMIPRAILAAFAALSFSAAAHGAEIHDNPDPEWAPRGNRTAPGWDITVNGDIVPGDDITFRATLNRVKQTNPDVRGQEAGTATPVLGEIMSFDHGVQLTALERIRFNPARIQLRRSSWHIRWA
jgi:hypothetical protein